MPNGLSAIVASKVVMRSDPDYFDRKVVFNTVTCQAFEISPELFVVLDEIARGPLPSHIARTFLDAVGEPIGLAYDTLQQLGILLEVPDGAASFGEHQRNSSQPISLPHHDFPATSSPTQIEICITRRCNQSCVHCNVSAVSLSRRELLPIEFWIDFLDQCVRARVLKLKITGGEPFLREGFDSLFNALVKSPIAASILTNAVHIQEYYMPLIAENGYTLAVSLDGTTSDAHDDFRRSPGAFEQTIGTMRKLAEHGVEFTINSVLHRNNVDAMKTLLAIADDVGAAGLIVTPMGSVGRGSSIGAKAYYPDASEFGKAIEELKRIAQDGNDSTRVALLNPEEREVVEVQRLPGSTPMSRRPPTYCKAGVYAMAVDEDGLAYSCLHGLQERIYPIADLKQSSLQQIWEAKSWKPFRSSDYHKVPCRVEDIGQNPKLYVIQ